MIKFCDEKGDEKEEPVGDDSVEIGPLVEGLAGEETDAVTLAQSPEPTATLSAVKNEEDGTWKKAVGGKRTVKDQKLALICSNMFDVLEQEGDQVEETVERIAIAEVDVPNNGEDGKGLPYPEEVKENATKISELADRCVRVALAKKNTNKKDWWKRAKSSNAITRNYFVLKRNGNILCQVHDSALPITEARAAEGEEATVEIAKLSQEHDSALQIIAEQEEEVIGKFCNEKGDEKKEPVAHDKLVEIGPGFLVPPKKAKTLKDLQKKGNANNKGESNRDLYSSEQEKVEKEASVPSKQTETGEKGGQGRIEEDCQQTEKKVDPKQKNCKTKRKVFLKKAKKSRGFWRRRRSNRKARRNFFKLKQDPSMLHEESTVREKKPGQFSQQVNNFYFHRPYYS